jgi:hypothetical protein
VLDPPAGLLVHGFFYGRLEVIEGHSALVTRGVAYLQVDVNLLEFFCLLFYENFHYSPRQTLKAYLVRTLGGFRVGFLETPSVFGFLGVSQ